MSEVGTATRRVLYVDDDPDWRDRISASLGRADGFVVLTEPGGRDALGRLDSETVDCVLSAHDLPDMDGLAFLEAVRDRHPGLPVVLLPDEGSQEMASAAISAGVTEYLPKATAREQDVLTEHVERAIERDGPGPRERERDPDRYRTLVENVADPMYVLDTDGVIRMVNRAMSDYLGYDRAEMLGETPEIVMSEEHVERGSEVVAELLEAEETACRTWEMDAIHEDGSRSRTEVRTSLIYDGGEYAGSVGVIRDIEERKDRERELQRFETVVQAVGDPVYALDEDGQFTFVNEAFEPMTGYDTGELLGEHIGKILTDEGLREGREYVSQLVAEDDRRAVKYEIEVVTADGKHIPSELHLALLPGEDGEFQGTAGIIRDIAERKEREQRLEQFASVVSHDLRGPLNVVLGQAQLARKSSDTATEHLDTILDSAKRMDSLIGDLLTLARQGETVGDRTEVDLALVVDGAWNGIETAAATLDNRAAGTVAADPERLQELFENLFRNSIEHGGPAVTVTVGTLDDGAGFYVADDGPGIPDAEREKVFEQGFTTSENGTGFGLAIVDRIAEAHGWTVTLTESDAGGARFEFETA